MLKTPEFPKLGANFLLCRRERFICLPARQRRTVGNLSLLIRGKSFTTKRYHFWITAHMNAPATVLIPPFFWNLVKTFVWGARSAWPPFRGSKPILRASLSNFRYHSEHHQDRGDTNFNWFGATIQTVGFRSMR